jgi:hypothetical protein
MARQIKRATADKILALELLDGVAYSEEYRHRVQSTLPPGAIASEKFWYELEATLDIFLRWERRRLRRPPLAERDRWQRTADLTSALAKELREADRQTLWSDSDPGWAKRALKELGKVRLRARARIEDCDAIAKGYKGRRNDSRESLYAGILGLWTEHLGRELKYSAGPSGPLIRFFSACVDPFLGDEAPTAHAVAAIIDRTRCRVLTRQK